PCLEANLSCAGYPARLVWSTEKNQRSFSTSSKASNNPTNNPAAKSPQLIRQASQDLKRSTSTPVMPKIEKEIPPATKEDMSDEQVHDYDNFQWGVKAILLAKRHKKSKVLDTLWKFVKDYLSSNIDGNDNVSFELRSL